MTTMTTDSIWTPIPTAMGDGWRADVLTDCIYVTVSDFGDPLLAAIDALIPDCEQRAWLVQAWDEDEVGQPIWKLYPESTESVES